LTSLFIYFGGGGNSFKNAGYAAAVALTTTTLSTIDAVGALATIASLDRLAAYMPLAYASKYVGTSV